MALYSKYKDLEYKALDWIEKNSFTLPPEHKRKWLEDLRSGDYKRARTFLYREKTGGFCCLGVYAKGALGWETTSVSGYTQKGRLRNPVSEQIAYQNLPYDILPQVIQDFLSYVNDTLPHASFYTIADWIEEHL